MECLRLTYKIDPISENKRAVGSLVPTELAFLELEWKELFNHEIMVYTSSSDENWSWLIAHLMSPWLVLVTESITSSWILSNRPILRNAFVMIVTAILLKLQDMVMMAIMVVNISHDLRIIQVYSSIYISNDLSFIRVFIYMIIWIVFA